MPKDTSMYDSHDTEESWEVLSRTASNSSTDSRTPVALHFPIEPIQRSASAHLDHSMEPPSTASCGPQRRMSLDERALSSRRRVTARRFRHKVGLPVHEASSEEDTSDAVMDPHAVSNSPSPTTSLDAGSDVRDTRQPPQPFYGVLAGESWYTVPGTTPVAAQSPICIVVAGMAGSGKTCTCRSFRDAFNGEHPGSGDAPATSVAVEGRPVTLVDTPGLEQPGAQEAVLAALKEASSQGGTVALALISSIRKPFDSKQAEMLADLLAAAGPNSAAHTFLVFTNGDATDDERAFLPNYVDEAPAALQDVVSAVDHRTVVVENMLADTANRGNAAAQLSRVVAIASQVAVEGHSAPWVCDQPATESRRDQPGSVSDVSRFRKAVVYSLAACGMMGLRVLTSGGNGFAKARAASHHREEVSGDSFMPSDGPLSWQLDDGITDGDEVDSGGNGGGNRTYGSDGEAFVQVAATVL